jgi:hypothetical protein
MQEIAKIPQIDESEVSLPRTAQRHENVALGQSSMLAGALQDGGRFGSI